MNHLILIENQLITPILQMTFTPLNVKQHFTYLHCAGLPVDHGHNTVNKLHQILANKYLKLYQLHIHHHIIPAKSPGSERAFHLAGIICSERRNSPVDSVFGALLL